MKTRTYSLRLFNFLLAGLVGLAAALPVRVPADDTDIYLGSKTSIGAIQPNVLFVLDTSGSMSNTDDTDPEVTRLDRMKEALHTILDIATNINVGLMRFHRRGGPVLYPVSDIDADVCTVEGGCPDYVPDPDPGPDPDPDPGPDPDPDPGPDLTGNQNRTSYISSNDDDGVEDSIGKVTLDGLRLHVGTVDGSGATEELVSVRITSDNDDAEEDVSDGGMYLGSSDLELSHDGSNNQITGLRFPSVNVPNGATIVSAEIVFEVDQIKSGEDVSLDLDIWGESPAGARGAFTGTAYDISSRPRTSTVADWNDVANPNVDDDLVTSDISAVVQEMVNHASWSSNQAMVFMLQRDAGDTGNGNRTVESHDGEPAAAPELRIRYLKGGSTSVYRIGLRYQGVDVPQGSTITYAELDFVSGNANSEATKTRIYGEDVDDAAPFSSGNVSDFTVRNWTAPVDWNPGTTPALAAWTAPDQNHKTPDIKAIVQKIVNRTGWCGGNDMAFFVEVDSTAVPASLGKRSAYSYNEDSTLAPVLRLSFDADNPQPGANGCGLGSTVIAAPQSSSDDAEEAASGSVDTGSSDLELVQESSTQTVGIRFPDLGIPQGATIISADITFTADETDSGVTSLTFRAEKSGDAAVFSNSNNDISGRPTTTASVTWDAASTPAMVAWNTVGDQFTTPSLVSVVQEVVNQAAWSYGNSMAFIITGSGKRVAESQDGNAIDAPRLRIEYQTSSGGSGGSASEASGGAGGPTGITVRDRLHQIVDDIQKRGGTPILGAMAEAAHYYRGEPVYYGLQRGPQQSADKVTRVSHPASWTGGTVVRPAGCTDLDLDADACIDEIITGSAVYKSPITASCQESYIILLSDGSGYVTSEEKETAESDPRNRTDDIIGTDCGSDHDTCVIDLVSHMHTSDQIYDASQLLQSGSAPLDDDQLVHTYTIGFNAAGEADFLTAVANAAGGKFYDAESASDLASVFKEIIGDILKRSTSLASPSLAVNAFNKLFHRDEVYFSLFEPSLNVGWQGNVKKYKLCPSFDSSCELGDVLDANDNQAIGADNKILETAVSLWGTVEDGREIRVGGAGAHVPGYTSRVIYTDVSLADDHPATPVELNDSHKVKIDNTDLRDAACADPSVGNTACDDLIEWMLGRDVTDEDDDGSFTDNRWPFADPLHSSPVVVSYGGSISAPVDKLFVGTNEGGVRMINGATGEEEWAFLPQVMLDDQETLMDNPVNPHIYGLDGVPAFRIKDVDLDGKIEPLDGDYVHMFIGMRRGGRNIYALDVTPTSVLSDPSATGGITPKLLWRIVGGNNDADGNYSRLGQTWSRPKVTTIYVDDGTGGKTTKTVLLFGGGYDATLDSSFGTSVANPNLGNAIYIVDADDGTLMRWISSDAGADLVVPGMVHAIPSDLATMDSNADNVTDRVYVGDTGGNVWRVDLGDTISTTSNGGTIVGKLASVSTAGTAADERRILYPPDVVQVHDSEFFSGTPARYDLVTVVTGNRADPLDTSVSNQVYAFRDLAVSGMTDVAAPFNIAEDYPKTGGAALDQSDLVDVTDNALQDGDDTAKANALAALKTSRGWYLNLTDSGEKALAAPVVLGGKLFFTTYLPEASSGSCEAQEGAGRLYAVDVLNAKAVINFDGIGDDSNLSASDRTYTLGGGIPSSAVPIFQEEGITLLIGTSAGGESVDPELGLPRIRTFWHQEE